MNEGGGGPYRETLTLWEFVTLEQLRPPRWAGDRFMLRWGDYQAKCYYAVYVDGRLVWYEVAS